jgi:predicted TIM-barrel fold metal-dependent hydrolase
MIIDGHAHMITPKIIEGMSLDAKIKQGLIKKYPSHTVKEHVEEWLSSMDKNKIEKTVFMANTSLNKDFTDFINSSERFIGFARINPSLPDAILTLEEEIKNNMKGIKLYATQEGFDVGRKECYPVYEYCAKKKFPVVIHFGVTLGNRSILIKGNPLLLSKVLKDFPDVSFIIAHFGAGFLREVLMLKYKQENLFVDSSGTNNWLDFHDGDMSLTDVFKRALKVFTSKGIIFGSDTRIFPDGYRENILNQQRGILDELNLSEEEKQDVMYNNAKRIFGL